MVLGSEKLYCLKKEYFCQRACRIILGPPKQVLHLAWRAFVISTAIRTALEVVLKAQILEKEGQNQITK